MIVASGARMRRSVPSAIERNCASDTRRYTALAIAARRIAVPVADAQFRTNVAGSARAVLYAASPMRAGSTRDATTGYWRKISRWTIGTLHDGASAPRFSAALTGGSPQTMTATLRKTHGIHARRASAR